MYFTLREDIILRDEPQYFGGIYTVRDSQKWHTYYVNESGFWILSAIARGVSLEEIITPCTPSEPAHTAIDPILKFIAGFISRDIIKISTHPHQSPDFLIPSHLPQVKNTGMAPMKFPTQVDLLVTNQCNLRCMHCLIPHIPRALPGELTLDEITCLLQQLDQFGVYMVRISGGEPLTRPDFLQIIQFTRTLKMGLRLLTNGTLITEAHVAEFSRLSAHKKWGFMINVSLDGATAHSHEWMRGVPGCFQKTVDNLSRLHEAGIPCTVETIVHPRNIDEIEDLVSLCVELGVKGLNIHPADTIGRAITHPESVAPATEVIHLLPVMSRLQEQYKDKIEIKCDMRHYSQLINTLVEKENHDSSLHPLPRNTCEAGMYSMSVGPTGKVYPCNYAVGYKYFQMGDIRTQNLVDIWHNPQWNVFRGGWQLESLTVCGTCPRFQGCPLIHCRVYPTITQGDFYGPMPECATYITELQNNQCMNQQNGDPHLPAGLRLELDKK